MILSCQNLCCQRTNWNECAQASIREVTLSFSSGTFYEFGGPDYPGRDLLMNNLALLEPWDSGTIRLDGRNLQETSESDLRRLRNETFGFVFDHPCLLPSFSVAENVAMPLFRICGIDADAARERTHDVLEFCGIPQLQNQLASRLGSSAQHQAALARALVHRPQILVGICPSAATDLHALAWRAAEELGLCVLWAGQDGSTGVKAQGVIRVRGGQATCEQKP
jgi:putative ABC transport system ATP-binding protein